MLQVREVIAIVLIVDYEFRLNNSILRFLESRKSSLHTHSYTDKLVYTICVCLFVGILIQEIKTRDMFKFDVCIRCHQEIRLIN